MYFLALLISFGVEGGSLKYFYNLLLIQNLFIPNSMPLAWSWSVAVEAQFYLSLPLILYLIAKTRCKLITPVVLFLAAIIYIFIVWFLNQDIISLSYGYMA